MTANEALIAHAKAHSKLTGQDVIKFLFQGEFGCGHLIPDLNDAHERFCLQWQEADFGGEVFEPLGNGFCRINLAGAKAAGIPMYVVLRMFFASAGVYGSKEGLILKLEQAVQNAKDGRLACDADALNKEVQSYINIDMPIMSHSAQYKNEYSPSYRVVKASYCTFLAAFEKTAKLLAQNSAPIIAIDGQAAAGKSTLAWLLASIFPSNVVHADSFFLPKNLRTQSRLEEIGGNVHYERLQELLQALPAENPLSYKVFDCKIMDYLPKNADIMPALPVIIEGSYSMHPKLNCGYDLKIFVKTSKDEQQKRILKRDGKTMLKRFTDEWIPMENRYFDYFEICENCDLVFET